MLLGSFIDGCTSYSYPLAQAYIADITPASKLSEAYGLFQGVATGGAFLVGIPLSGILASKVGLKVPLYIAASISALNILYISTLLPESLPPALRQRNAPIKVRRRGERRSIYVCYLTYSFPSFFSSQDANAIGAFKMVFRNPFLALCSLTYFLLHTALNGLQVSIFLYYLLPSFHCPIMAISVLRESLLFIPNHMHRSISLTSLNIDLVGALLKALPVSVSFSCLPPFSRSSFSHYLTFVDPYSKSTACTWKFSLFQSPVSSSLPLLADSAPSSFQRASSY